MAPPDQLEMAFPEGCPLTTEQLKKAVTEYVRQMLETTRAPTAGELLDELTLKFDWRIRQLFAPILRALLEDASSTGYRKEYLRSNFGEEDIAQALRGDAKPSADFTSAIDSLMRKSRLYRKSSAFKDAIEFAAKFRQYKPFNNLLVKIQNPSCGFYATEKDWWKIFKRRIKEDARPMLILAPMHPVLPVYDLDATEGPPLPDKFEQFAHAESDGRWESASLEHTLKNAERDLIQVRFKQLSRTHGGFASKAVRDRGYKMRIVVHDGLDAPSRYAVLCHELAHIYLGHLGSDKDGWWPSRINLTHSTVEIEAEAASYIIGIRSGLKPSSESYLASYLTQDRVPETVSLELIAKVAGRIQEMGQRTLPTRRRPR